MRILIVLTVLFASPCFSNESSNAQEGSLNTNTVGSTVSSNNTTTDRSVSKTYNGAGSSSEIPVGSAVAPSYISNGIDTCLQGLGASLQTGVIGFASGSYQDDPDCNRRRDARLLNELNMKVAAIARMCSSTEVWKAMFLSGTPCPIQQQGRLVVGKRAFLLMKMNPTLHIPEYGDVHTSWHSPNEPSYTKAQLWYNAILGIGVEFDEEETSASESVSSKFRSSVR